jgi:TonB family protein
VTTPLVAPEPARLYSSADSNVVPPVILRQQVPSYPGNVLKPMVGAIEVVIDENGNVAQAMMRASVAPNYDRQVVSAAQNWRYRPATINGAPVKYRKLVQVIVAPQ